MSSRRRRFRRRVSLVVAVATTFLLLAGLLMGGGASWPGEQLLALGGLLLILLALARVAFSEVHPERFRYFWLLPLGVVLLPVLQLVPLPEWLWSGLPGRQALLDSLDMAGAEKTGWAPWSLVPLETERLLYTALLPIGIFMAAATMRGGQRRKLVGVCLVFGVASAFLGFWQMVTFAPELYFYEVTNTYMVGFFANRNHLADLMLISIPVTAGLLADRVRHHRRSASDLWVWLGVALLVIFAVTATATASRTGLLLLVPALIAAWIVFQWSVRGGMPQRARGMLALGVLLAVGLIVQFTLYSQIERLIAQDLAEFRDDIYLRTWMAAAPSWGSGYGIGSFFHAYDDIGDIAADYAVFVNRAHNDYLELWLEGGLLGFALIAGFATLLVLTLRRMLARPANQHDEDTHHRGLQLGAGFGLAITLVHSMVDYPLRTLTIASYAALLAAIMLGTVRVTSRK